MQSVATFPRWPHYDSTGNCIPILFGQEGTNLATSLTTCPSTRAKGVYLCAFHVAEGIYVGRLGEQGLVAVGFSAILACRCPECFG